ncbi:MAG TPA: hypothetical protein VJH20_04590 [Candidatus Nanoarchaeia archaeon]|nr:hypothetical protein [Candidatus Nanoarchaeia archaeon]
MRFYKDITIVLFSWNIYSSFVLIMWYELSNKSFINLISFLLLGLILIGFYLFRSKIHKLKKKNSIQIKSFNIQQVEPNKVLPTTKPDNSIKKDSIFTLPQLDYDNFFNLNLDNIHDLD